MFIVPKWPVPHADFTVVPAGLGCVGGGLVSTRTVSRGLARAPVSCEICQVRRDLHPGFEENCSVGPRLGKSLLRRPIVFKPSGFTFFSIFPELFFFSGHFFTSFCRRSYLRLN